MMPSEQPILQRLHDPDPRQGLKVKLEIRQKIISQIEARLHIQPDDSHQLFLIDHHLQVRDQLTDALRQANLQLDQQHHELEAVVESYLQQSALDTKKEQEIRQQPEYQALLHQQQTWQSMIDKVRQRLVKKPGDSLLTRLLGEHQARLLTVQDQIERFKSVLNPEIEETSLEQILAKRTVPLTEEKSQDPDVSPTEARQTLNPKQISMQREQDVLLAMIEKTHQRLHAKPELLHLKGLIEQHQNRLEQIRNELATLD